MYPKIINFWIQDGVYPVLDKGLEWQKRSFLPLFFCHSGLHESAREIRNPCISSSPEIGEARRGLIIQTPY
jgi:hypothetical protein